MRSNCSGMGEGPNKTGGSCLPLRRGGGGVEGRIREEDHRDSRKGQRVTGAVLRVKPARRQWLDG